MTADVLLPDENAVAAAVRRWLQLRGFEVDVLVAGQRGYDVSARHPENGQQWVIEAKGGTSSIVGSRAYGRNYGRNDAYIRVAQAFWLASHWTSRQALVDFNIGMAIPASKYFDIHSEPIEHACRVQGIAMFRVSPNLDVRVFPSELEAVGSGRVFRPGRA